jgi:hypothetical protein
MSNLNILPPARHTLRGPVASAAILFSFLEGNVLEVAGQRPGETPGRFKCLHFTPPALRDPLRDGPYRLTVYSAVQLVDKYPGRNESAVDDWPRLRGLPLFGPSLPLQIG